MVVDYVGSWEHIPDGLVGNDDLSPLLLAQLLSAGIELSGDNVDGLVGFPLLWDVSEGVHLRAGV